MQNPENLEAPNPSERRPRSTITRVAKTLGATAINGAGQAIVASIHSSEG